MDQNTFELLDRIVLINGHGAVNIRNPRIRLVPMREWFAPLTPRGHYLRSDVANTFAAAIKQNQARIVFDMLQHDNNTDVDDYMLTARIWREPIITAPQHPMNVIRRDAERNLWNSTVDAQHDIQLQYPMRDIMMIKIGDVKWPRIVGARHSLRLRRADLTYVNTAFNPHNRFDVNIPVEQLYFPAHKNRRIVAPRVMFSTILMAYRAAYPLERICYVWSACTVPMTNADYFLRPGDIAPGTTLLALHGNVPVAAPPQYARNNGGVQRQRRRMDNTQAATLKVHEYNTAIATRVARGHQRPPWAT